MYKKKNYMPYVFAGVLYLFVTMFGPRMHERYFFPAVAFFAVAYILSNNRVWLWIYTALSTFGFLTVAEVLLDLEVGKYLEATTGDYDRYSYYLWVEPSDYRMFIGVMMVLISLVTVAIAIPAALNVGSKNEEKNKIWMLKDGENNCEGELPDEK